MATALYSNQDTIGDFAVARQTRALRDAALTDLGNAERFIALHGHDLRYVPQWGWLSWDGRRWCRDSLVAPMEYAKDTVRRILQLDAEQRDGDLERHARKSESFHRLQAMLAVAQSDPRVVRGPEEFDTQPMLLTCLNGTLDLETGQLRSHVREDHITRLAPVAYDRDAWHPDAYYAQYGDGGDGAGLPLWNRFIRDITEDDPALAGYLQRAVGYSLTGSTREAAFFIAYGGGRNGKSKFLEAVRGVFGDYGQAIPTATLLEHYGHDIPNDLAALAGSRLATAAEPKAGAKWNESIIKQLTGGDSIAARFLHREFFTFRPVAKLWLGTNHKPETNEDTAALWRRIKLIPFLAYFDGSRDDPQIGEKLIGEAERILAWAVQGCLDWQRGGLGEPERVQQATQGYRDEQDVLGDFLLEQCQIGDDCKVKARELYKAYERWVWDRHSKPLKEKQFLALVEQKGFRRAKQAQGMMVLGVGLTLDPWKLTADRVSAHDSDGFDDEDE
jgi:putative DNA primase/helicase